MQGDILHKDISEIEDNKLAYEMIEHIVNIVDERLIKFYMKEEPECRIHPFDMLSVVVGNMFANIAFDMIKHKDNTSLQLKMFKQMQSDSNIVAEKIFMSLQTYSAAESNIN